MTGTTRLDGMIDDYLRVRRALGYELRGPERTLRRFAGWLDGRHSDAEAVTFGVADAVGFATGLGGSPRSQALRLSAIRCFARWASCQDPEVAVPPARLLPARPTRAAPYIYTDDQVRALIGAAGTLQPALHAAAYQTLIGLMAATGIRTGEAVGLDTASLDRQGHTLTVTGKYGKVRMLPLHPSVQAALADYIDLRDRALPEPACPALLVRADGTRLRTPGVQRVFRQLTRQAGLIPASSACRPRLHDLRHSFAVATMLHAYESGQDPAAVLPVLSTWLGHTDPRDTYWYVTGTAELMAAAARRVAAAEQAALRGGAS